MKVAKERAIELISQKINQFDRLYAAANLSNKWNARYLETYQGAMALITELFSETEAEKFRLVVTDIRSPTSIRPPSPYRSLEDYQRHLLKSIINLKTYRERVANFWSDEETVIKVNTQPIIPFISMSFDENDKQINDYITGILSALRIEYESGERYSKDSIPEKVKNRIINSGLFIVIFTKREKKEDGSFTTSSWLVKELGIAQGCGKEIIALVERGINEKEIANVNWEKELIYFEMSDVEEMGKTTIKFLEALKEHRLI